MKPGRELDALVAEKVMGLKWGRPGEVINFKHYSTNMAAAWELVEKAKIESVIRIEDGRWVANTVGKYPGNKDAWPRLNEYYEISLYENSVVIGETAPHAICLAALKAVGVKV